jgi:hypothetical protein
MLAAKVSTSQPQASTNWRCSTSGRATLPRPRAVIQSRATLLNDVAQIHKKAIARYADGEPPIKQSVMIREKKLLEGRAIVPMGPKRCDRRGEAVMQRCATHNKKCQDCGRRGRLSRILYRQIGLHRGNRLGHIADRPRTRRAGGIGLASQALIINRSLDLGGWGYSGTFA